MAVYEITSKKTGLTHEVDFGDAQPSVADIEFASDQADAPTLTEIASAGQDPNAVLSRAAFGVKEHQNAQKTPWEKTKELGEGVLSGVGNLYDIARKGIGSGMEKVGEFAAEPTLEKAGNLVQTAVEGAGRGTYDLANLSRQVIRDYGDWALPPLAMFNDLKEKYLLSAEDKTDAAFENYLSDVGYEQVRNQAAAGDRGLVPELTGKADNDLAEASSLVLDPVTLATLGVSAVAEAPLKALGKGLLKKTGGPMSVAAEKTGEAMTKLGDLPSQMMSKATKSLTQSDELAKEVGESVNKAAPIGAGMELSGIQIPVLPGATEVATGITMLQKGGRALEKIGEAGQAVTKEAAKGTTQQSVLKRIAKNADQPEWLRKSANALDTLGFSKGAEMVGSAGRSTLSGAATGAGLGALTADDQNQLGQAIGTGGAIGLGLSPVHWKSGTKARRLEAEQGSINNFVRKQMEAGTSPEILSKLDRNSALQAATLAEAVGDQANTRFVDQATFEKLVNRPGAAAAYVSGEILVNADAKNLNQNFLHEYGHAVAEMVGVDNDIRKTIDGYLGKEGVDSFKRDYAEQFIKNKNLTPEQVEAQRQSIINELDAKHGPDWGYQEIFAEGFVDTFFGRNIRQTLDSKKEARRAIQSFFPIESQNISLMGRMLRAMGVDVDGITGEVKDAGKTLANISDPALRKLVIDYTKAADRFLDYKNADTEMAREVVTKEDVLKDDPRMVNSPWVARDANGRPIGIRTKREYEEIMGKIKKGEEVAGTRGRTVQEILRDKITTGDEAGMNKPGKKLPEGLIDQMEATGQWTKTTADNIRLMEQQIADGKNVQGWYHSVMLKKGNIPVDFKDVTPMAFHISNAGNIYFTAIDTLAAEKKVMRLFVKNKAVQELWNNAGDFRSDVFKYMETIGADDAYKGISNEVFGEKKAKILNAFFKVNVKDIPNDASAVINTSKLRRNPDQLLKSYRIDRWDTVAPSDRSAYNLRYERAKEMYRPEVLPDAKTGGNAPEVSDLGFYSQVEATAQKLPEKMTVQQLKAAFAPEKGVKPEELQWMGFDEFLKGKGDQDKLTRADVEQWVAENKVDVEEVVLGGGTVSTNVADKAKAELNALGITIDRQYDDYAFVDRNGDFVEYDELTPAQQAQADIINDSIGDEMDGRAPQSSDGTKFGQWQVPGGENYRELLLTLPERGMAGEKALARLGLKTVRKGSNVHVEDKNGQKVYPIDADPYFVRPEDRIATPEESAAIIALRNEEKSSGGEKKYQSTHFGTPNILAHVRFNDRTVDGKRVLFLEEVQSDWHQQGRKQGYRGDASKKNLKAEMQDGYWEVKDDGGNFVTNVYETEAKTAEAAIEQAKKRLKEEPSRTSEEGKVPDAPFKKSWHELALKRMMRWAAENGYDKIAWTTGERQASRYDLSKQVDKIESFKHDDGQINVLVRGNNGKILVDETGIEPSKLSELVGKEIAEKIIAQEAGEKIEYKGDDLKVGGEGMKGFYDSMLPKAADKLGKKWGAKTKPMEMQVEKPAKEFDWLSDMPPEESDNIRDQASEEIRREYPKMDDETDEFMEIVTQRSVDLAEAWAKENWYPEHGGGKTVSSEKVHSIDITPEMRESVGGGGLPLFRPEVGKWFEPDDVQSGTEGGLIIQKDGESFSLSKEDYDIQTDGDRTIIRLKRSILPIKGRLSDQQEEE